MKQLLIAILLVFGGTIASQAQSVLGTWKTVDDETGKAKSYVEISERNGKLYGKITKLLNLAPDAKQDPTCDVCKDDRKSKKIIGMEIIRDMKKEGGEYEDGTILDPGNGTTYDCKIWIDSHKPDVLNVRGYVAFFYRTQTWHRVK